jgi:HAE1 family hydrophobic/amphiphilic exporter-1
MSVVRKSIDHPVSIVMVYVLLCGVALAFVGRIPVALNPETEMPMLSVSTSYSGAGPEDVEENVTIIVENALASLKGLSSMSSTSSQGSSNIRLQFGYEVDLDQAEADVESIVSGLQNRLPDDASSPSVRRFDQNAMPIMRLIITGERSLQELQVLGENEIQPRLERIEGVASASVFGGSGKTLSVKVSQNRLAAYGLSFSAVTSALSSQSVLLTAGKIVQGETEYQIRADEKLTSVADVKSLVIKTVGSGGTGSRKAIRMEDVADIELIQDEASRSVYYDGLPVINIQIMRDSDSNAVQISKSVKTALSELNGSLPEGVSVEIVSDDTSLVNSTLTQVYGAALQGIILAILILLLYLRNLKATFIIAISIPISILLTLMFMYFMGLTLNSISLTGLIMGMGMIVDASIVILDNIYHYRLRGTKPRIAAILGSQEMVTAVLASTLTTLCVFIPMILFRNDLGMMGQLFKDLVFTICFSLTASLVVAMTLVPVLSGPVMKLNTRVQKPLHNQFIRKIDSGLDRFFSAQERVYKKGLEFCLRNRLLIVSLVAVVLVSALLQLNAFSLNLFPRFRTDDSVTVNVSYPTGTARAKTSETLEALQDYVKANVKGYERLILSLGGGSSSNSGSLQIVLPDPEEQIETASQIRTKLNSYAETVPGGVVSLSAGRQFSTSTAVDVELRSRDQDAATEEAEEIKRLLDTYMPELENVTTSLDQGSPELLIRIDRDKAAIFGFSVSQIAREIRNALYGTTVTSFSMDGETVSVFVQLREEDRATLSDIQSLFLLSSSGARIPVSTFVSIENSTAPRRISRENRERVIHVQGSLPVDSSFSSTEAALQVQTILDSYYVPKDDVSVAVGGERREVETYLPVILLIIGVAVFLVYGVMASQFESFVDPFIIFLSIPLMFVGVVWIYKLTGDTFSLFSMIGVVALAGVVVNNGIILVDYTNTLRARGYDLFEACAEAGKRRLRPILMSTLTTLLGIMPLALFPGSGTESIQPIAKTMFGGLAVSSVFTLFLTPVLYHLFNSRNERKNAKRMREVEEWRSISGVNPGTEEANNAAL